MTRVALDSSILIRAELEPDSEKGTRGIDLVLRSARNGVIPLQVLGEYPSEKTNLSALMTSGD